jgi:hypothetical protein
MHEPRKRGRTGVLLIGVLLGLAIAFMISWVIVGANAR